MVQDKVNRDAYFIIDVEMYKGFKFKIPARGYNLKSWLDFQKKMQCKSVTYSEVTQREYDKKLWGI